MGTRQDTLTGYQCHHAGDTDLRPHCEGFATVAYGCVALCGECDAMRSAVGREHAGRKFPGACLEQLACAAEAVKRTERPSPPRWDGKPGRRLMGSDRRRRRHYTPGGSPAMGARRPTTV